MLMVGIVSISMVQPCVATRQSSVPSSWLAFLFQVHASSPLQCKTQKFHLSTPCPGPRQFCNQCFPVHIGERRPWRSMISLTLEKMWWLLLSLFLQVRTSAGSHTSHCCTSPIFGDTTLRTTAHRLCALPAHNYSCAMRSDESPARCDDARSRSYSTRPQNAASPPLSLPIIHAGMTCFHPLLGRQKAHGSIFFRASYLRHYNAVAPVTIRTALHNWHTTYLSTSAWPCFAQCAQWWSARCNPPLGISCNVRRHMSL